MDFTKNVREFWSRLVITGSQDSYSFTSEEAAVSEEEEVTVGSLRTLREASLSREKTRPQTPPPSLSPLEGACLIPYASPSNTEGQLHSVARLNQGKLNLF